MAFKVQNQIRQNASDIRNYLDDLFVWEDQINNKKGQKPVKKPSTQARQNAENFPIRGQAPEEDARGEEEVKDQSQLTEDERRDLIRDSSTIPDYYKAWDKFDVDKELSKLETQEEQRLRKAEERKEQNPPPTVNPMQKTSGADKNMRIVVKGGRSTFNEVESLKEKGNLFFKSLEYSKAIEVYGEAITKGLEQKGNSELMTAVYSNRAMAYLKIREYLKAEDDCTKALEFNDKHVKSYVRRGQARRRLEKYKESLKDFQRAGEVEPENKEIQDEIKTSLKKINSIKEEQKKKMVLPISITNKPRVTIKVKDFDPEKVEQSSDSVTTTKPEAIENKEQTRDLIPHPQAPNNTGGEVVSEFIALKDVEGKVVRHVDHKRIEEEGEAQKQKVHFRLDLNTEDRNTKTIYPPVQLDKMPKKPSLKRKRQFSKEPEEVAKTTKKTTDISELKTSKAVLQGKEIWHKQVIEEYENTTAAKPKEVNVAGNKAKEEPKKASSIMTSNEFLNTWKHIRDSQEACEKLLLGQVRPERFAELFKVGIDFDYYMELIKFAQKIIQSNKELSLEILEGLSKVKRFDINVKSMLGSEKKVVKEIVDHLREVKEVNQENLEQLAQKYKI